MACKNTLLMEQKWIKPVSVGLLIHIDDIRYQEGQAKCPKSEWVGAFKVVGPFFCCP
jgi:hypothetical protein